MSSAGNWRCSTSTSSSNDNGDKPCAVAKTDSAFSRSDSNMTIICFSKQGGLTGEGLDNKHLWKMMCGEDGFHPEDKQRPSSPHFSNKGQLVRQGLCLLKSGSESVELVLKDQVPGCRSPKSGTRR